MASVSFSPLCTVKHWSVIATMPLLLATASPAGDTGPNGRPLRLVRIGHYQCVSRQDDFEANLATARTGLQQAIDAKLDIVSFPECFLTGYYKMEKDARRNAFAIGSPEMKRVLALTAGCDTTLLIGFNELRAEKLYNTVAVIERGQFLGRYSKALPFEGYFEAGREFPVFE